MQVGPMSGEPSRFGLEIVYLVGSGDSPASATHNAKSAAAAGD